MDLKEKKKQIILLFIIGFIVLKITAEKCRELAGEQKETLSQTGKFSWLDCFDFGTGSIACAAKQAVTLYVYNMRSARVEKAKLLAMDKALNDAMSQGVPFKDAKKQAEKVGKKAAKLASEQTDRITGPIITSGWDFFEAVYYGGSFPEGAFRGQGMLLGSYGGGFFGEQLFGRLGYLLGSQFGGWVGGRIGLMVHDVAVGVQYLIWFFRDEEFRRRLRNSDT
ncbi:uncharacterized protein LOC120163838 [Hibiscus syriacus]|uniref:uncharacterized protein LOC120163838 n=1 Tax=Hibiscus syriacus TaxID=106335 RepID=UPI001923A843|nr:uncharacterized protein LOC120163838 [Hibiscus syriacus]